MLPALVIALTTSYVAWFIERNEAQVLYPFDDTYTSVTETGEARLSETRFETADGESLVVWTAPPRPGHPTVVYFKGNAGTLADRTERFSALLDEGLGLVAFAYRGSSGSSGRPSEEALTRDARDIAAAAASLAGGPDGPLVLYGESLGCALAVKAATAGIGDAVILQSPFASIRDLARAQYPDEDVAHLFTQTWDTRSAIRDMKQPLLILHGTADRLVPIAQGEELLARAGSSRKTLHALAGQGHSGLWTPEARAAILLFVKSFRTPQASAFSIP